MHRFSACILAPTPIPKPLLSTVVLAITILLRYPGTCGWMFSCLSATVTISELLIALAQRRKCFHLRDYGWSGSFIPLPPSRPHITCLSKMPFFFSPVSTRSLEECGLEQFSAILNCTFNLANLYTDVPPGCEQIDLRFLCCLQGILLTHTHLNCLIRPKNVLSHFLEMAEKDRGNLPVEPPS